MSTDLTVTFPSSTYFPSNVLFNRYVQRLAEMVVLFQEKVDDQLCRAQNFKEGLGRLSFAAGPFDHFRPLLGPL